MTDSEFATVGVILILSVVAGVATWLLALFVMAKIKRKPFHEILNREELMDRSSRIIFVAAIVISLVIAIRLVG